MHVRAPGQAGVVHLGGDERPLGLCRQEQPQAVRVRRGRHGGLLGRQLPGERRGVGGGLGAGQLEHGPLPGGPTGGGRVLGLGLVDGQVYRRGVRQSRGGRPTEDPLAEGEVPAPVPPHARRQQRRIDLGRVGHRPPHDGGVHAQPPRQGPHHVRQLVPREPGHGSPVPLTGRRIRGGGGGVVGQDQGAPSPGRGAGSGIRAEDDDHPPILARAPHRGSSPVPRRCAA